jgi:hypothetical protein
MGTWCARQNPSTLWPSTSLGAGPALGGAQNNHRPAGAVHVAVDPGIPLNFLDLKDTVFHHRRHFLVHLGGVAALHDVGGVAVASEQGLQFFPRDAGQNGGVGNLIAVQVQNGQHCPIPSRVDELVGVPGGGQGTGFRFPIAHHAAGDQLGVVQNAAVGVADAVAQFPPFVDGPGRFRGDVAADVAGEGKLLEEALHPLRSLRSCRDRSRSRCLPDRRAKHAGCTMAGPGHEDHVQVVLFNQPIAVDVGEAEGRGSAPVAQQAMLDMLGLEGFFQQGIIPQVNHADGQVVTGPPVGVNFVQFFV